MDTINRTLLPDGVASTVHAKTSDALVRSVLSLSLNSPLVRTGPKSLRPLQEAHEIVSCTAVLSEPRARVFCPDGVNGVFSTGLAAARFLFMLAGSRSLDDISCYSPGARRFTDDGITIPGSTYGARIFYPEVGVDQFQEAARLIKERPNTKRATMALYSAHDTGRESRDVPCALNVVFVPRDEVLHCVIVMRANNALRLLPYNLFEFSLLQEYMASYTGLALGRYIHTAVSMHLYAGDAGLAEQLTKTSSTVSALMHPMPSVNGETRRELTSAERTVRESCCWAEYTTFEQVLRDTLEALAPYWADILLAATCVLATKARSSEFAERLLESAADLPGYGLLASRAATEGRTALTRIPSQKSAREEYGKQEGRHGSKTSSDDTHYYSEGAS